MRVPPRYINVHALARKLKTRPQPRRFRGQVLTVDGPYAQVDVAGSTRNRVRVPAHLTPAAGDSVWVEYHVGTWTMLSVTTGGASPQQMMTTLMDQRLETMAVRSLEAEEVTEEQPWEPRVLGYPKGWRATTDLGTWTNLLPNNQHAPGVSGWRLEPPDEDTPPLWVRPASTVDAYDYGDRVTFPDYETGDVYRSVHPGKNTWSPTEYPEGWELEQPPTPPTPPTPEEPEDPPTQPTPEEPEDVPVWEQPVWAGEEGGAYSHGQRVRYPDADSPIYVSTHEGWNTWAPDEYGWELEDQ